MGSYSLATRKDVVGNQQQVAAQDEALSIRGAGAQDSALVLKGIGTGNKSRTRLTVRNDRKFIESGGLDLAHSKNNNFVKDNAVVFGDGHRSNYSYTSITSLDDNTASILDKALSGAQESFDNLTDDFFSLASGIDIQPNNTAASFNFKSPMILGVVGLIAILLLRKSKK